MALRNDSELPVCPHCGWALAGFYEVRNHPGRCDRQQAGALAVKLAESFPEIDSTKYGFGHGRLAFLFDDGMHIKLECDDDSFRVEDVWLLGNHSPDAVEDLVKTLAAWRARTPKKVPDGG